MARIDIIIRNTANQEYELLDAGELHQVAGPYTSFAVAVHAARSYTTGNIYQQVVDNRGRVMGEPLPIHPQFT